MKKLLALLLALVMVASMAACGAKKEAAAPAATEGAAAPAETEAAAPAETEAAAEGAKTLYVIQGPQEYFEVPWFNCGAHTWVKALYETVIGMDNKGAATTSCGMAESYEMAADGLSLTITLRDGLKWHDGEPVTADDVMWSIEALVKAAEGGASIQNLVKGGCQNVESMSAEGNVITFKFAKVLATQLQCFTQLHVLPKHCLENVDYTQFQQDAFFQSPIGSGPFKVESAVMNEYANFVPFEEYWGGVANYNIYATPSHMDADPNFVTKVMDGKLDYGYTKNYADVQALEGVDGVTVTPVSVLYTRWLSFNQFAMANEEVNPLSDLRVRQAIAYAIDRKLICAQVFGGACDPGDGTLTPTGTAWKVEGLEAYDYNPEKAKQLLADAGWDSSRVLKVSYYYTDQQTVDLIAIIQQMLAQVGIQIEGTLITDTSVLNGQPADRTDVKSKSQSEYDMGYAALAATSFHNYYDRFHSTGVFNGNPVTPELDAMIDALMLEPDTEKQKAAYAELEKWYVENMYILPLYYQPIWVVTSDKVVDNLDLANLGNPQFDWDMQMQNWVLK